MVESHSQSFFGQNTGLIISSFSKFEPYIFIRCIKKKADGKWQKPSENEGKLIKCSLEEIISILDVLNHKELKWQGIHSYKDNKTILSFSWEDENSDTFWINIGDYSKMLNLAQAELLRLLLSHILKEKIIFATSQNRECKNKRIKTSLPEDQLYFLEDMCENDNDQGNEKLKKISKNLTGKTTTNLNGKISKETNKAVLIKFESGKEIWIPKSSIHCHYIPRKNLMQKFLIDNWILKRNKITL
ncbi:MAG: hypothetical protein ACFFD5_02890 [Candidatus Thorarchaeota archaeon]